MPVEDLARSDVVTASPETPITDLAESMDERGVGSVVIIDETMPKGIVTDRDLAIKALTTDADPDALVAADVMSDDLTTIEPDHGFYEAMELMSEHGVRRLPVMTLDDELVGIITADDLTELLADESQQLARVIQNQRPPY